MWTINDSLELYGIERWGNGYFSINNTGNLIIMPYKMQGQCVDIMDVIKKFDSKKATFPVLFRFPQILENRLSEISQSFIESMEEFEYVGGYKPVFPMKVNQRRDIIEYIVKYGNKLNIGLEVGSKAELLAALSFTTSSDTMLICNGYKDGEYLKLALNSYKSGKNINIVIDLFDEIFDILRYSKELKVKPPLGLRVKLISRGNGRWAESGGESSKFGLSTSEILEVIKLLSNNDMLVQLDMLHFHIGSQITDIKRIKDAVNEAARIYSKIKKMANLTYFNIGGGLSVDYDGSRTASLTSANYSLREYTKEVVNTIKNICDEENVPPPTIISESGRATAAYHSFLVFKIIGTKNSKDGSALHPEEKDPSQIKDLYFEFENINIDNYAACYHNAIHYRDELYYAFNKGDISLEDRAKGEKLFWMICRKAKNLLKCAGNKPEEVENFQKLLSKKYIGNFSIFQSVPDMWGVGQIFPTMPVHRLEEMPTEKATIADITCDSDGEIKYFAGDKEYLELCSLDENEDYYIGIFLLGAYQDTLGDFHNLLGRTNEVHVMIDEEGWRCCKRMGDTCESLLDFFEYDNEEILRAISGEFEEEGDIDPLDRMMRRVLRGYTYFDNGNCK